MSAISPMGAISRMITAVYSGSKQYIGEMENRFKKETENIICWTGKQRKIIWLVCVRAVHGLRTAMSPQFSTTTYCVVLLKQHGNPPQHCHVPCHGGSMEGSRAAQTLTLSSIDRGVLRFFSGVQQQYIYSYTQTPKPTQ